MLPLRPLGRGCLHGRSRAGGSVRRRAFGYGVLDCVAAAGSRRSDIDDAGNGVRRRRCRPFRERNRQLRKSARTSLRELCLHDRSGRHGFGRLRPDTGARGGIATSGAGEPAHNARSDTDSRPRRGDDQGRRLLRLGTCGRRARVGWFRDRRDRCRRLLLARVRQAAGVCVRLVAVGLRGREHRHDRSGFLGAARGGGGCLRAARFRVAPRRSVAPCDDRGRRPSSGQPRRRATSGSSPRGLSPRRRPSLRHRACLPI